MKKDLDSTHVFQNGTGQQIIKSLDGVAKNLSTMAIAKSSQVDITNYRHIQRIVQMGLAKEYFQIGDQIHTTWKPDDDHEYDMPWDVVDFGPCEDPDGVVHLNAMWLQSHYTLPEAQVDAKEAFYVTPEEMPAGAYYFKNRVKFGTLFPAETAFHFVISTAIPAGGQLVFATANNSSFNPIRTTLSNWRIKTYLNSNQIDPTETLEVTIAEEGTYLGYILNLDLPYSLTGWNSFYRFRDGYNRWSQSALRQWLNSDKATGEWWKPQNPFDRPPKNMAAMGRGFINDLPDDFLKIVKPVRLSNPLNPNTEFEYGEYEKTNDRFFIASATQEYIDLSSYVAEEQDHSFSYWENAIGYKRTYGSGSISGDAVENYERLHIVNHGKSYAQLRSNSNILSGQIFIISNIGNVMSSKPCSACDFAPCCVIY